MNAPPATATSLLSDLHALGVPEGGVVLVHSSLSRLGWIVGGAQAVVMALVEAVGGPTGTIVMPTHSSDLTEPSHWRHPAVPKEWWDAVREFAPAYDRRLTPTRGMGAVVECFRHLDGVERSGHPSSSFAAWGRRAQQIAGDHALESAFGERSPLARIYDLDGWALLLGVGHASNTSLHLAEHRASYPGKEQVNLGAPVLVEGARTWIAYSDLHPDGEDFEALGEAFDATGAVREGTVGAGPARLMKQRDLVDFGAGWIERHR